MNRDPSVRDLVGAPMAPCPVCGAPFYQRVLDGVPLFVCAGGCAGARVAFALGVTLPSAGPLYAEALRRRAEAA